MCFMKSSAYLSVHYSLYQLYAVYDIFSTYVFCTSVDSFRGRFSDDTAVEELLKKALNEVEEVMECVGESVDVCGVGLWVFLGVCKRGQVLESHGTTGVWVDVHFCVCEISFMLM